MGHDSSELPDYRINRAVDLYIRTWTAALLGIAW